MFCPKCQDEFRSGFTRCESCNVDLVDDLSAAAKAGEPIEPGPPLPIRLADYCGYLSLDEARQARDQLRPERIHSEIVLREPPGASWDEPPHEEFWLRIDASQAKRVAGILGAVPPVEPEPEGDSCTCGDCGQQVAADELFCPKCGARFDE